MKTKPGHPLFAELWVQTLHGGKETVVPVPPGVDLQLLDQDPSGKAGHRQPQAL